MASLATLAATHPATIKGLSDSSLSGTMLLVKPNRQALRRSIVRVGAVVAKYGDKGVYFDLEDLGNTTGQWGLYGSDATSPYNPLPGKLFEHLLHHSPREHYFSATAANDIFVESQTLQILLKSIGTSKSAYSNFIVHLTLQAQSGFDATRQLLSPNHQLFPSRKVINSHGNPDHVIPIKKGPQLPPKPEPRGKI